MKDGASGAVGKVVYLARWPASMTIATAAAYLDCSETEVRRLIDADAFPAMQFGPKGIRRVRRDTLDEWLAAREEAAFRVA